ARARNSRRALAGTLQQVIDIERAEGIRQLALTGVREVVQAAAQRHDVLLGLVLLADRGLRGGDRLQQVPEEADVGVPLRLRERAVVQLLRAEGLEFFAGGHGGHPTWRPRRSPA